MLFKTRYFVTARFFDEAKLAKLDGSWPKLLKTLHKTDLLILDDFGLHPMDPADRQLLLDVIETRHQTASTILCSQIPVSGWRSEEHTSELQSRGHLVCRLLLEKKRPQR